MAIRIMAFGYKINNLCSDTIEMDTQKEEEKNKMNIKKRYRREKKRIRNGKRNI